jgi:hypothetical protein
MQTRKTNFPGRPSRGGLDQFETIPERIVNVDSTSSVKRIIFSNRNARVAKVLNQSIELGDQQGRVSLSRWPELLLHPEMHLQGARPEPHAATMHEVRRFRDLRHTQQASIEPSRVVLTPSGHRELHVVYPHNGHLVVAEQVTSLGGGVCFMRCQGQRARGRQK